MGGDPSKGIVSSFGQVFKAAESSSSTTIDCYDNLYAVDGSIVPSSLAWCKSLINNLCFDIQSCRTHH